MHICTHTHTHTQHHPTPVTMSVTALHGEPYIMFSMEKKIMLCINCFRDMRVWVLFCHFCMLSVYHCHMYSVIYGYWRGLGTRECESCSVTFSFTSVLTRSLFKETRDIRAWVLFCHFCIRYRSVIYCSLLLKGTGDMRVRVLFCHFLYQLSFCVGCFTLI